jgi:hypothetical protein
MCSHTIRTGSQKLLLETRKPDYPVSLISTAARGTVDVDEKDLPLSKRRLDGGGKNHDKPKGLWQRLLDLIARKTKSKESRAKN